ncbi:anthranilate phosphoribosyltransferase [Halobacteriales archaeon SW_7_71_33]|nr:MAG: anthranilate phosphoribosyltransferase [Halobacteriales archaeon SW_7_71_33]
MDQTQQLVERATDGEDLTQAEAREATRLVLEEATEAQIGALLAALRAKGETEAEIAGLAEGMREAARTIDPDRTPLVDTCGTGGDDHDTVNVSTGSADVLEAVGVDVEAGPATVEETIEREGVGFMLAPVFHPAMKAVIGPRRELGMRTVFNVLGPLTNPAGADAQVVGVYDPDLVPVLARALARMDVERALVVHGDGLDEIAVHGETRVAEVDGDDVETDTLAPADLGVERHPVEAVAGGDPEDNAADMRAILQGDLEGAKRDIVVANAGAAVCVAGETDTIAAGVERAREAIESGAAAEALASLTEVAPAHR